jgi:hypothetical protein
MYPNTSFLLSGFGRGGSEEFSVNIGLAIELLAHRLAWNQSFTRTRVSASHAQDFVCDTRRDRGGGGLETWRKFAQSGRRGLGPPVELDVVVRHRGPVAREHVQRIRNEQRRATSLRLLSTPT